MRTGAVDDQSPNQSSLMLLSRTRNDPAWWRIAAGIGPRMPRVAEAIATALRPKAKIRMFWRMIATVALESLTRSGKWARGSPRITRSPAVETVGV